MVYYTICGDKCMSQEEIIKCLKLIEYKKDDKNIRIAIRRLLESEKYSSTYRGIITDPKIHDELVKIVYAFKKLKDLEQEEIDKAISRMFDENIVEEKNEQEDNDNCTYEFIRYFDKGLDHIAIKNMQTGNYEETVSYNTKENDYVTGNYVVKKDDGIYDYFGNKIFPYKKIDFVADKYYQDRQNKNIFYDLNNCEILDITKINNANVVLDMIKYNDTLKVEFLSYLFTNKSLPYLKYKIEEITDRYLYCTNGNEICYCDLNGEKVLSTEDSIYSFIAKPAKERNSFCSRCWPHDYSIIIVGQYDNSFKQKYGYYDLVNRKEILKPQYSDLTDWIDICGIGDGTDIITKNKIVQCEQKTMFGYRCHGFSSVIDIGNNYYLIECGRNGIMLIYDLLNKPKKIDWIDGYIYKHIYGKYIIKENSREERYIYYDNGEKKELTISNLLNIYSNAKPNYKNNNNEECHWLLNSNSAFLCLGNKEPNYLIKKDEINYSIEKQNNIKNIIGEFYNNEKPLPQDCSILPLWWDSSLMEFSFANQKDSERYLINIKNNKILNSSNFKILWIDLAGNITMSIKWGNGTKEFILDMDGNILLGPVDDTTFPIKNMRIVTNQNKMMLYMNYKPLSYQADRYEIIYKKYIIKTNNKYKEIKSKEIILVENEDNLYVIDEDGDKLIRMSQKTKDLMSFMSSNDILPLDEEEKEKRLIYGGKYKI